MSLLSVIGTLAIVAATEVLDRRNAKVGEARNLQDRCARCGTPLGGHSGQMINLSGYGWYTKGQVCAKCYAVTRSRDRILHPLVYAVMAVLMFIYLLFTHI
ncbi:MAG: hypothetical protein ABIO49_08890 [Dokdonella sp.]